MGGTPASHGKPWELADIDRFSEGAAGCRRQRKPASAGLKTAAYASAQSTRELLDCEYSRSCAAQRLRQCHQRLLGSLALLQTASAAIEGPAPLPSARRRGKTFQRYRNATRQQPRRLKASAAAVTSSAALPFRMAGIVIGGRPKRSNRREGLCTSSSRKARVRDSPQTRAIS